MELLLYIMTNIYFYYDMMNTKYYFTTLKEIRKVIKELTLSKGITPNIYKTDILGIEKIYNLNGYYIKGLHINEIIKLCSLNKKWIALLIDLII